MICKGHMLADQINLNFESGVRIIIKKNSISKCCLLSMPSFKKTIITIALCKIFWWIHCINSYFCSRNHGVENCLQQDHISAQMPSISTPTQAGNTCFSNIALFLLLIEKLHILKTNTHIPTNIYLHLDLI